MNVTEEPNKTSSENDRLNPARRAVCQLHQEWNNRTLQQVLQGPWPPVAVLKGTPLAERLYTQPSDRLSNDLDLLISSSDLPAAQARLMANGYQPKQPQAATWRYFRRYTHHLQYVCPHAPPVELHFRLFTGFGVTIPSEPFLSRTVLYTMQNGLPVHVLSAADEFFFLSIHAARHAFRRTIWLNDLHHYLQNPNLNLRDSYALAQRYHVRRSFLYALQKVRLSLPKKSTPHLHNINHLLAHSSIYPHSPVQHLLSTLSSTAQACRQTHPRLSKNLYYLHEGLLSDNPAYGLRLWTHHLGRSLARKLHLLFPRWTPPDWAG